MIISHHQRDAGKDAQQHVVDVVVVLRVVVVCGGGVSALFVCFNDPSKFWVMLATVACT